MCLALWQLTYKKFQECYHWFFLLLNPSPQLTLRTQHLTCICKRIGYINSVRSPWLCEEDTYFPWFLFDKAHPPPITAFFSSPLQKAVIWMGRSTTKQKPWKIVLKKTMGFPSQFKYLIPLPIFTHFRNSASFLFNLKFQLITIFTVMIW